MRPKFWIVALLLLAVTVPVSAGPLRRVARGVKAAGSFVAEKRPVRRVVKKIGKGLNKALPPYRGR